MREASWRRVIFVVLGSFCVAVASESVFWTYGVRLTSGRVFRLVFRLWALHVGRSLVRWCGLARIATFTSLTGRACLRGRAQVALVGLWAVHRGSLAMLDRRRKSEAFAVVTLRPLGAGAARVVQQRCRRVMAMCLFRMAVPRRRLWSLNAPHLHLCMVAWKVCQFQVSVPEKLCRMSWRLSRQVLNLPMGNIRSAL